MSEQRFMSVSHVDLGQRLTAQRSYFASGQTRPLAFRLGQLQTLQQAIQRYEPRILEALRQDLGKPPFEAYATEVGFVRDEIRFTIKHLAEWMAIEEVKTPWVHQPASSHLIYEPYGLCLIIAPWNYPFQLTMAPLIGALAAGNCAVLKPSELTPATSALMAELIQKTFDPHYVSLYEGDLSMNQALLAERFDHIFFTGSTRVGKIVMQQAAEHLTPVVLELGGKSPCIVDRGVPLDITARRIVWGKFINAGQTCVAPDYVLVPPEMKVELIQAMEQAIKDFYGLEPKLSPDYARIINAAHFERLQQLMSSEQVIVGGQTDALQRYIAPTLLSPVSWENPIMQDEIFGPLLPVLTYRSLPEAIEQIRQRPRPLALYLFSENRAHHELVMGGLSFGGGCINDTIVHLATPHLPFGGIGSSGMGAYHGRHGFETFSHRKALMKRQLKMDLPLRYPPYSGWKEKVLRQVMK